MREAIFGFVIGGGLGLLVGLYHRPVPRLGKVFGPFLTFANSLPEDRVRPDLPAVVRRRRESKIVLAVVVVFFIVQVPTHAAVGLSSPTSSSS